MILVTHDLGVVADMADRIAVMYAGRIVEQGTLDEIFYDPQHPYTWGLLGSITRVDRPRPERLPAIAGLPPSLADRPEGCHFRPRCPTSSPSAPRCRRSRRACRAGRGTVTAAGSTSRPSAGCARSTARRTIGLKPGDGGASGVAATAPLLEVEHLKLHFPIKQGVVVDRTVGAVHAVNDVTFKLGEGRRWAWWGSRAAARPRCRAR